MKQFCKAGHDTFATGRWTSNNGCKVCAADRQKLVPRSYWRDRQAQKRQQNPAQSRRDWRMKSGAVNPSGERIAGPCEVCRAFADPLQFDHDHTTGAFRGWLCGTCNRALGQAKDNPELLRKLAQYLEFRA